MSGSGKSSLAFDTIYAEGQRRYVESLSTYARQFLEQMRQARRRFDRRAVAGHRHRAEVGARATRARSVGTITEIYDYLRLLWARVGDVELLPLQQADHRRTHPADGRPVLALARRHALLGAGAGHPRPGRATSPPSSSAAPRRLRARQHRRRAGRAGRAARRWTPTSAHTIEIFIDRLVQKDGIRQRLTDSIELAAKLADGLVKISPLEGDDILFSREVRLPHLRHHLPGDHAPPVLASTTRPAPARRATASGRRCSSTPI